MLSSFQLIDTFKTNQIGTWTPTLIHLFSSHFNPCYSAFQSHCHIKKQIGTPIFTPIKIHISSFPRVNPMHWRSLHEHPPRQSKEPFLSAHKKISLRLCPRPPPRNKKNKEQRNWPYSDTGELTLPRNNHPHRQCHILKSWLLFATTKLFNCHTESNQSRESQSKSSLMQPNHPPAPCSSTHPSAT